MPSDDERLDTERAKLDDHEKAIDAMLLGLAGGLLAFAASIAVNPAEQLDLTARRLIAVSVAASALSLGIGALRMVLRTWLYRYQTAAVRREILEHLRTRLTQNASVTDAGRNAGLKDLLGSMTQASDQEREAALNQFRATHPSSMSTSMDLMAKDAAEWVAQFGAHLRLRRMRSLAPLQVGLFILGVAALATLVLRRLAAT